MALPVEFLRQTPAQQVAALRRALAAFYAAEPGLRKQRGREALMRSEAAQADGHSSSEMILVWIPSIRGTPRHALAVPFSGKEMSRETYRNLLLVRLEKLVATNTERAYDLLTGSPEHHPDLYTAARWNPAKDWPIQIMMCGQMGMCLSSIDWDKGWSEHIPAEDLSSLDELLELL